MKDYIFPAVRLTVVCLLFFSGIYTLVILGFAEASPNKGKGEIITANGNNFYSNIGQKFTDDLYFYSRLSAVEYKAAGAAGSNKGPSNPDYLAQVQARNDTFSVYNPGINNSEIPLDLVTASSGGLNPYISVEAVNIKIKRIATIRGIAKDTLQQLILNYTEKPLLGFAGTQKINVLDNLN